MRNAEKWSSSKFVYRNGKLAASKNPAEVGIGSRLVIDLIASFYDQNLKKFARGRLADLGCGKVPLYEAYKPYVTANVCVDWGNSLHRNELTDHECDLAERLPFNDGEFDTIILSDVLEHVLRPEALWSEMSRILSTGGKLMMNVPFYYWLHETPHDYYRFTEYALASFAESSGFKILLLNPMGGVPEVLADIMAKNLVRFFPRLGKYPAIFIQAVTQWFLNLEVGKKISTMTGKRFPIGYFLVAEKVSEERARAR